MRAVEERHGVAEAIGDEGGEGGCAAVEGVKEKERGVVVRLGGGAEGEGARRGGRGRGRGSVELTGLSLLRHFLEGGLGRGTRSLQIGLRRGVEVGSGMLDASEVTLPQRWMFEGPGLVASKISSE